MPTPTPPVTDKHAAALESLERRLRDELKFYRGFMVLDDQLKPGWAETLEGWVNAVAEVRRVVNHSDY